MSRKIIYLINPISGTRGKRSLKEMIRQKTQEQGIDFSILPTNAEGDYSYLSALIREEGVTDIVICGGDGTVSAVGAALCLPGIRAGQKLAHSRQTDNVGRSSDRTTGADLDRGLSPEDETRDASPGGSGVRIGVIPMGSGNGLAFAAGIPKDPARALAIIFAGKASPIDGVLINDAFSCMLAGIGMDGKVAHEFAGQQRRGLQTYIRITMRNFFSARPYPFRLYVPSGPAMGSPDDAAGMGPGQEELAVDAFFISIANGNQFGNNFTIAPRASLHDGLLDIVIAKKTGRLNFLWSVIRQVLGGYPVQPAPAGAGKGAILYFKTPSLVIENPGDAPLHIDGDPKMSARRFRIEVVPNAIRLIQP